MSSLACLVGREIQGEVSVTSGWRLDFLADFAIPYEISDGLVPWFVMSGDRRFSQTNSDSMT